MRYYAVRLKPDLVLGSDNGKPSYISSYLKLAPFIQGRATLLDLPEEEKGGWFSLNVTDISVITDLSTQEFVLAANPLPLPARERGLHPF